MIFKDKFFPIRPGGEGGYGHPEAGKIYETWWKGQFSGVEFENQCYTGRKRVISLVLTNKASFSCIEFFLRFSVCVQMKRGSSPPIRCSPCHGNRTKIQI